MKTLLKLFLPVISLFLFTFCGEKELTGAENPIQYFKVKQGASYNHGLIDHEGKTITIKGISDTRTINDVVYGLSEYAESIEPDPKSFIGKWHQTQSISVLMKDGNKYNYEIIFPDYKDLVGPGKSDHVVMGYFTVNDFQFEEMFDAVDWSAMTHILPSFCWVRKDGSLNYTDLKGKWDRIVAKARPLDVKILVSFMSEGKGEFKTAIASVSTRETLAKNIVKLVNELGADGIDIDYEEYPINSTDLQNLYSLFESIHKLKNEETIMSCAINGGTWTDYGKKWHTYFDYINLLSYSDKRHATFETFVEHLKRCSGYYEMPREKIVGGVPFYGVQPTAQNEPSKTFRFNDILRKFPDQPNILDGENIGNIYYNGRDLLRKKCNYVKENGYGGIMIWQVFQDAADRDKQLMKAIKEEMFDE